MIKYLIFLILLSHYAAAGTAYVPPDFLQAIRPIRDACIQKTGCPEELILNFISGSGQGNDIIKSYMVCVLEELKVLDPNGNVMTDKLFEMLPDNIKGYFVGMDNGCEDVQGTTLGDQLLWIHECWRKIDPEHYFMGAKRHIFDATFDLI